MLDLERAVEKIKAVRAVADETRIPIVINARTEIYLLSIGQPETRYSETLRRLSAYRDAGADCLFAPGLKDPETIGRLAKDLQFPLNILAGPGWPSVPELEKLGVARISLGSGPMRATLGLLRRMAEELKTTGTYGKLEDSVTYAELNELLM